MSIMNIQISDPFLSSIVGTPLQAGAAAGASALDTAQRSAVIGEVIPIVFCRRVNDIGGVLVSPPATEAQFHDASNTCADGTAGCTNITVNYHLVLSEGQIDSIQRRDVFQRSCRVGVFTQTYNRRAGNFVPGNFINHSPNIVASYYCGTGGSYANMSTMAFYNQVPIEFNQWDRQVHCLIRGGMHVTRLLDAILGASNNVVDLLLYFIQISSKVNSDQIDTASLLNAARFTNTNGLFFNGVIAESINLRDWMGNVLQYYLLRSTRIAGKEALKPLLPFVAATGAIHTGAVSWVFSFNEEHIVPGSFSITYTPLSDRKLFCVVMLWRQQPTNDIGLIRSTEVRYTGTAVDGPFEQHDISAYCASENHAVKVGAYILSRRYHITHTLAITVRPDSFNATLSTGDLVRVQLKRTPSTGVSSLHDFLYEVDRIGKSLSGEVLLQLTEFPIDNQLRSIVALEVASAVGNGILFPTGITGVTCDTNSSVDTSVPAEVFSTIAETIGANTANVTALEPESIGLGFSGSGFSGSYGSGNAPDTLADQRTTTVIFEPEYFIINYTWNAEGQDLDTRTQFLSPFSGILGWGQQDNISTYAEWGGDNQLTAGTESVLIRSTSILGLGSSVTANLRTQWYGTSGTNIEISVQGFNGGTLSKVDTTWIVTSPTQSSELNQISIASAYSSTDPADIGEHVANLSIDLLLGTITLTPQ